MHLSKRVSKYAAASAAVSAILLIEFLKIYPEEQLLKVYNVVKHLILLKIQNVMDIK